MAAPSKRKKRGAGVQYFTDSSEDDDEETDVSYFESDSGDEESDCTTSESDSDVSSSSSTPTMSQARKWCKISSNPTSGITPPPPRFRFDGKPGVHVQVRNLEDALEYLEHYVDTDLIDTIVKETNRYADQCKQGKVYKPKSRVKHWSPTNPAEIWVYIAMLLLQGIIIKPVVSWYWSTKKLLSTPIFPAFMSERRFSLISKFLHFVNNETLKEDDHPCWKLRKIYPVLQHLNSNFKTIYTVSQNVSIDESLLKHKGRLSWKQYIPLKRARFGLKFFMLCEADTGYIWSLILYTGKGMAVSKTFEDCPVTVQVVLSLLEPLLNQGYCLTADNYYMSPELVDTLIKYKTDSYGTVKANRKDMPPEMKKSKLKRGDVLAFQRGKLMAMKWKDKKDVYLLSTIHNAEQQTIEQHQKEVTKPKVVLDYNNSMGGVDRADQSMHYYQTVRKRMKIYYKKIFRHLLDQAVLNAYIIQRKLGGPFKTLITFRLALIEQILAVNFDSSTMTKRRGRRSHDDDPVRLTARHFPDYLPPTPAKDEPTRRCHVCCKKTVNGKRVRKETRIWCPDCEVALCNIPCFRIYHCKHNY